MCDVLGDGRLLKEIVHCGEGSCPEVGVQVAVHYVVRLGDDIHVLDSSRDCGQPLTFTLGQNEVILGWDHGVATMKPGERAVFRVHPDLAHGMSGCNGGAVPPDPGGLSAECSMLRCEIELLDFSEGDVVVDPSPEEILQSGLRARERGNAHFKVGEFEMAVSSYTAALQFVECETKEELEADGTRWVDIAQREERRALALACNLNMAQCELRLSIFASAAQRAALALAIEPSSSKAIYRRGAARLGLGDFEGARADLVEAARREPKNAEVRAKVEECRRALQASQVRDRSVFGGMFNANISAPDSVGSDAGAGNAKHSSTKS